MQNSIDEDQIPLLDDLIVPGKVIKRTQVGVEDAESNDQTSTLLASAVNPETPASESPKTAFEATIEAMVTEILNRHMEDARKEITRRVLAVVRARLTGGSKTKQS